jgi:hypothetical protein
MHAQPRLALASAAAAALTGGLLTFSAATAADSTSGVQATGTPYFGAYFGANFAD